MNNLKLGLFFLALKFSNPIISSEPIRVFVNNRTNKPLKITQGGREILFLPTAFHSGHMYATPGAISFVISKRKHRSDTTPSITYQLTREVTSLEVVTNNTVWKVFPSFHDDDSSQSDSEQD